MKTARSAACILLAVLWLLPAGCARYNAQGSYLLLLLLSSFTQGQTGLGRIFLTAVQTDGNIGGISSADAICNSDVNRPSTSATYKALLVDGVARRACSSTDCTTSGAAENVDWVFRPNTSYYRPDGTLILTTDSAGIAPFNITAGFTGAADTYWTGMRSTPNHWQNSTANRCNFWATTAANGATGIGNATDNTSLRDANPACTNQRKLLCVEQ